VLCPVLSCGEHVGRQKLRLRVCGERSQRRREWSQWQPKHGPVVPALDEQIHITCEAGEAKAYAEYLKAEAAEEAAAAKKK
jgi:hypothetical protein